MSTIISGLLNDAATELCQFLGKILPVLGGEGWWKMSVVNKLSHQQARYVEQRRITTLDGLDLAALLRILDQNWYEISWKMTFPPDARHYIKEMQTIRNRWAHTSVQAYSKDDVYRDLDTLQRFLS